MSQDGFSLIETVIALGLFVIVLFAFLQIFSGSQQIFYSQQGVIQVSSSANIMMTDIATAVAQADQVLASYTFSSPNVTYSSGTGTLVLELPAFNSSGNIVSGAHDYIAFYSSGANGYETVQADASSARLSGTKKLTDAVSSLGFTYNNVTFNLITSVDTSLTTQTTAAGLSPSIHLDQLTYLRNAF